MEIEPAMPSNTPKFVLTTPVAIIIGAVIIACGLVGYGYVSSLNNGGVKTVSDPTPKILKALGINKNDFNSCVNNHEEAPGVKASTDDGVAAGVQGTPTTFIVLKYKDQFYNIATVEGSQSYSYVKDAIDQALALSSQANPNLKSYKLFKGKNPGQNDFMEGVTSGNPVYAVEYSDPECPFCIKFYPDLKQIRADYDNRIAFIYRNFPLTQIHPHAQKESEMISCVGKLGGAKAYFGFMDSLFEWKTANNMGYFPND